MYRRIRAELLLFDKELRNKSMERIFWIVSFNMDWQTLNI